MNVRKNRRKDFAGLLQTLPERPCKTDRIDLIELARDLRFPISESSQECACMPSHERTGRLDGARLGIRHRAQVIQVSSLRAVAAVHQAAPYAPEFRGKSFSVNFIASKACSDQ